MKKLRIIAAALAIFMGTALPVAASAQADGGIWNGLWEGANLDFSSLRNDGPGAPPPHTEISVPASTTPTQPSGTYAALGDSVAAGLGLPQLTSPTTRDTQCGRSSQAYAYQVGQARGLTPTLIACSGATAGDLVSQQGVSGPNITAQLTTAFMSGTPQLITITAGANDIHWDDFLRKCYALTCGTSADTTVATGYQSLLRLKLQYIFADIQARSGSQPPTVVVTGYYNPLSSACLSSQRNITSAELRWISSQLSQLNTSIQTVASQYAFVRYAPVDFSGHDICSTAPWVQGLQDNAPFHPTAAGQQALAAAVLRAL